MFAGEQLIIMEMKPHTLYAGQTPDLVHFYNQPTRKELNLIFLIFFKDKTCKIFPFLSHIDLVFWLVPVWIYCGVFATIEGSIAPHLSPLVPQSGTRAQIWQIGRKITKEVGLVGRGKKETIF